MERQEFISPHHTIKTIDAGKHLHVVWFNAGGIGLVHRCRVVEGDTGPVQLVTAPQLANHTIVLEDPLTVSPSILCPDCKLHGFIEDGKWRDA